MINRLIDFSIKNKFIIGLFTLALIGLGIWSMKNISVGAVPDITNNQVQVITTAPSLSTVDVEQFITFPVEKSMGNLPGLKEIRSISRFGLSVVTLVFEDNMGTYLPRQLVSEKLKEVREKIPDGLGNPTMGPISTGLGQIYLYTLKVDDKYKDEYSLTELRTIQDWIVKRQMAMVPGVVEVNSMGGYIKQYEVAVNPDKLRAMNVTLAEVFDALENNNENTGGAYIVSKHRANFIRVEGLAQSMNDIKNTVVKSPNGIPVLIKDIGKVQIGHAIRYGAVTHNGEGEAVGGIVMMLKGKNSSKVIDHVKERMAQIEKSLPEGVSINPILDRSKLIDRTMSTITVNIIEGGLIVLFILMFLLGTWRGGVIVASTIPLSLLFAFIMMNVFGVWANLMSMGALDFGIIVDGAVIIVEATVFLLYQKFLKGNEKINPKELKEQKDDAARKASKKMMNTAFFGQLIILIVFVPVLFLEGVEGKMFRPMALTFIFAMLGAMILCLTYVPMVSALFLKPAKPGKKSWGNRVVHWVEVQYEKMLLKSFKRGKAIVLITVGIFAVSAFIFSRMGGVFMPQLDEGSIALHIILKPGSSLKESVKASTEVESILLKNFPEVKSAITKFGVSAIPTDPMPMDLGDCFVLLEPKDKWVSADSKNELIAKMKEKLSVVPGVSYVFTQPIEMRFNELLSGVRQDVAIKIFGENFKVLATNANRIKNLIANVEGVADVKVEATTGLPQITVEYNREKLARYGLKIEKINQLINSAFAGGKAGVVYRGERRFDLVVRFQGINRDNLKDVTGLYIPLPSGGTIPLQEVAKIGFQPGPMQISRENTNRRIAVGFNIRNRDVESVVKDIQKILDAQLNLPAGYYLRYGGAVENLQRATNRLQIVVPIALFLIFILIFFALKSFKQTLLIYIAIPMATLGGIIALWIRGLPFSISAGVGFIVLFGVAVLNGLVLMQGFNELKKDKELSLIERIVRGSRRRVRPIMMTALVDIFGFMPMAISTSAGAEVQRPLATVVIGGLLSATFLTLFIIPILYRWMENGVPKKKPSKKLGISTVVLILILFAVPKQGFSQEKDSIPQIGIEDAVRLSLNNFSLVKAKELAVEKADAMKRSAWDFGTTKVFTGGEELGGINPGIHTLVGVQQSGIDIFGIVPQNKFWNQKKILAENRVALTKLQLTRRVKATWGNAFIAKRKMALFTKLDSLYAKFRKMVALKYKVQAISELDYFSSKSQAKQISILQKSASSDYRIALKKLNFLLNSDTLYTVKDSISKSTLVELNFSDTGEVVQGHPLLVLSQNKIKLAEARKKMARADLLPKFNLQYGYQKIGNITGFYAFEIGVSIPLFSGSHYGKSKAAKIQTEIARKENSLTENRLKSNYEQAVQNYLQWKSAYEYYQNDVLPLLEKQRKGALLAYKKGAIDQSDFIQKINNNIRGEVRALEAMKNYLLARFQLEYLSK